MAHERLRFNIILKEKDESNDNKTTNTSYDPIYSDTKYNTHYGIFANFTGKKVTNGFKVNSLNFLLQNYTGEVSIGIKKVIEVKTDDLINPSNDYYVENFSSGRHIKIFIILQGLSNNFTHDYEGEPFILKNGDFVEVIPLFAPVDNSFSMVNEEFGDVINENCLFADSEYMIRDGENIILHKKTSSVINKLNKLMKNGLSALHLDENGNVILIAETHGPSRPCKMIVSDVYIM